MTVLAWATAGAALAGQASSGDRAVVVPFPGGALVALIDGLGHGRDACDAALAAERVLIAAPYLPVAELMQRCHDELRKTRGAVISMASFDAREGAMTWLGVGNVEGFLVRAQPDSPVEAVVMRGGTVGYMLPALSPRTVLVQPGDTLVLASDGIRHGFRGEVIPARTPQQIADEVMAHWAKTSDDACVVVARYVAVAATTIEIDGEEDVSHARIRARDLARSMGFGTPAADALATAVSELARNILRHAHHGEIVLAPQSCGLEVVARDIGPGIADIERALEDGFSTKDGLGCGLSGARRLVDQFEIASEPGVGTVVRIHKSL